MKIEKLNENQLKITLAPEDLSIRGLALNELSYGSPKTKDLYNELVEQALNEFGFESEDGALVIEAIPTSKGNLIIFITKNNISDDLDTRFSRFSPDLYDDLEEDENEFIPLTDMLKANGQSDSKTKSAEKS
ncbi:negative regulator of genetic competence MecA domain protein, partial [Fusobacterium sp. CM21]